jgi:hypothetical protein
VNAAISVRNRIRAANNKHIDKYIAFMRSLTGQTLTRRDVKAMSEADRSALRRTAAATEASKARTGNVGARQAGIAQKAEETASGREAKLRAIFDGTNYTDAMIKAGDFFDDDAVMDRLGSDPSGYPAWARPGVRRARKRRDEADLTPDDIAHATRALVRRQEIAMKEKQALMTSGAAPLLALARDRRTPKTQEFERYEDEKQNLASARVAEAIKWAHNHPNDRRAQAILHQEKALERRTSGTQEFERYEHEKQDLASARAAEAVKWAKSHPKDPRARAILKRHKAGRTGRLSRAKAALQNAGRTATHTILSLMAASLGAAVKFLSALPGVASDVNKMAAMGNALGISDDRLRGYRHMEDMLQLDEGTFAQGFGALLHSLPPVETGRSDIGKVISPIAAYVQKDPLSRDVIGMITDVSLHSKDVSPLWREMLNMAMRIGLSGKGRLDSDDVETTMAVRDALNVFDQAAPKVAEVGHKMQTWLGNVSASDRAAVEAVVKGEAMEINGVAVEAGDFYGAVAALMGEDVSWVKPRDTSTPVEVSVAKEVAQSWTDLAAAFGAIKRGILEQILGATERVSVWLEDIMHKILGLDIFKGRFDPVLVGFDEKYYAQHVKEIKPLDNQIMVLEGIVAPIGEKLFGHATEEDRAEAKAAWERHEGVPAGIRRAGLAEEYKNYMARLYALDETRKIRADRQFYIDMFEHKNQPATHGITGVSKQYEPGMMARVVGATPDQIAVAAANKAANAYYGHARTVDEVAEELLTGSVAASYKSVQRRASALLDARSAAYREMESGRSDVDEAAGNLAAAKERLAGLPANASLQRKAAYEAQALYHEKALGNAEKRLAEATDAFEKADAASAGLSVEELGVVVSSRRRSVGEAASRLAVEEERLARLPDNAPPQMRLDIEARAAPLRRRLGGAEQALAEAEAAFERAGSEAAFAASAPGVGRPGLRSTDPYDIITGNILANAIAERDEARRVYEDWAELDEHPALLATIAHEPSSVSSAALLQRLEEAESRVVSLVNALAEIELSDLRQEEPEPPWAFPPQAEEPGVLSGPGTPTIDRYLGQAAYENDAWRRSAQGDLSFVNNLIAEVGAQAGASAVSALANGRLEVTGLIKAEERTWTIEFVDKDTGKMFRVVGESNVPYRSVGDLGIGFNLDSPSPTANPRSP